MKVELESTDRIVDLELSSGVVVPARVWVGKTARGIECHAYITRIAVARELDASEFENELREQRGTMPAALNRAIPTRLVLG